MLTRFRFLTVAILFALALSAPVRAQGQGDVAVTVTYKGAGTVSASNRIWVFLFDHPVVTMQSQPVDARTITTNGGTAPFTTSGSGPLYVYVLFDERGDYDGSAGPPPIGTPMGLYSVDRKTAAPVKVEKGVTLNITFSDAFRWKG